MSVKRSTYLGDIKFREEKTVREGKKGAKKVRKIVEIPVAVKLLADDSIKIGETRYDHVTDAYESLGKSVSRQLRKLLYSQNFRFLASLPVGA